MVLENVWFWNSSGFRHYGHSYEFLSWISMPQYIHAVWKLNEIHNTMCFPMYELFSLHGNLKRWNTFLIFYFSTLFKSQVIKPVDLLMDWHDSGIFQRVNPYFGNPMYFHHIVLSISQCLDEGYHSFLGSLTILLKRILLTSANPAIKRSICNKWDQPKEVIWPFLALSTWPLK